MKKTLLILAVLSLTVIACNKTEKTEKVTEEIVVTQNDESLTFKGDFIYTNDAAVLKGKDFIYGVKLDEKAKELASKTTPLQREEYDMVPVVIKGNLKDNPNEGWEQIIEITEIVKVNVPTSELVTKIKSSTTEGKNSGTKPTE